MSQTKCLIVGGIHTLRFAHKHCPKCDKETLHRGAKCGICGHMLALAIPKPVWNGQARIGRRKKLAALHRDKRKAFKEAAQSAREKFEGNG